MLTVGQLAVGGSSQVPAKLCGCSHLLHALHFPHPVQCRPGVIISYLIGGIVAMLCAMAYMEFAAETRTAGASIVYTSKVFGKLVAW